MKKLALVIGLLGVLGFGAVAFSFYQYHALRSFGEMRTVVIAPGTGVRGIVEQLHNEGLIPALPMIAAPMFLSGHHRALKAGEYELSAAMSPEQIMEKIHKGEVVIHKITIAEGWNSFQVRDVLMKEPLLTGDLPARIPEGSVLPDTLHFARGESRASVLARMQKAQGELMEKLWPMRMQDSPIQTPGDAIALASIVEKETGEVNERALVAGVFVNRLRIGMMLQSDPTVVYGIEAGNGGAPMGRELSRGDLQRDTPYNTYTRNGLTPTPICNPGRKAIEAVLNPAYTDALFFVATGSGGHNFAKTLKEHEANVAAYRKAIKVGN